MTEKLVMITLYYDKNKFTHFSFVIYKIETLFDNVFRYDDENNMFLMSCKENHKKYIEEKDLYGVLLSFNTKFILT